MTVHLKAAYGGVVIDSNGLVLLREPANHFGGYFWTFPKGKADPGETPEQAALREVLEETGCRAKILAAIPGDFAGDTSLNHYFLMTELVEGAGLGKHDSETEQVRWVTPNEARILIGLTPNLNGRQRDLKVLETALKCQESLA